MFPLSDYIPSLRRPVVTYALIALMFGVWILLQGAGVDERVLASSVCNFGLIPAELTHGASSAGSVSLGDSLTCSVAHRGWVDYLTPLTSMFMHGGWMHIIGNVWFLRIFGDNVEDSMGRGRYLVFYLVCGLAAAAAQVAIDPHSAVPVVGASGAISGVMGAYLVLYPNERVKTLVFIVFIIRIMAVPAWVILLYWFALQIIAAVPQLTGVETTSSSGVAVVAHVGGFLTGALLAKAFANEQLIAARRSAAA